MNKLDLVKHVAECARITEAQARRAIDCYHEAIGAALEKRDSVTLVGFGTFSVRKRKARQGVNPQTGKKISIPAKNVPKFKPGMNLRSAVE